MGYITPGVTFSDAAPNNAVNAARLTQLVANAAILPSFISGMADASASVVDGDRLPIFQLSSSAFRSITTASLVAKATAAATAANPLLIGGPDIPGPAYQDEAHAWIKTNSNNFGSGGLRLWDDDANKWRRVYSVPVNTVVGYVGGTFDTTGLGTGAFDGWAKCNGGSHGTITTANIASPDGILNYMQFIGYTAET